MLLQSIESIQMELDSNLKEELQNLTAVIYKKKIVEEMARHLMLKESNAPRKPPRIILMGPPGVELV